jgi:3-deoxy-D-manno-octulosonic-acid transferase
MGSLSSVYALAATAASPMLRVMLRRRAARGKELAGRLPERLGYPGASVPGRPLLWLHAASVGETVSALPLLAALPGSVHVLFTTGTLTSATLLAARVSELGLGARVTHRFVPLDVPAWAARFLDHWRPDAACFLESELWPNLLAACRARRIPAALVNARLSARSAAGWARAPGFVREVLGSFAWIEAQSDADAERLLALGARNVAASGNLKFCAAPLPADPAALTALHAALADRPCWLAASTHPADDTLVEAAHVALSARHPGLVTAVAPRHPERGAALAARWGAPRRSLGEGPPPGGVWVADTLGELGLLYRCFPIVLMGKSFPPGGGQNPWEPAQLGAAVLCGPAMENFEEAVAVLEGAGGLARVADEATLVAMLEALLADRARCAAMGVAARAATGRVGDLPALLAARLMALMAKEA